MNIVLPPGLCDVNLGKPTPSKNTSAIEEILAVGLLTFGE